ncbi:hypothetical protein GDO86_016626 [Hymenochirus boettgeri]|uniref:Ig-like domain-containing protein n=1 Tax=Hymenochirus boettgeri TaxID=247094 RepID=A0A8T2K0Z3_9PIPI|nr:hypothetical protein GDO86_016626 [Hymenochirus boettgeri]
MALSTWISDGSQYMDSVHGLVHGSQYMALVHALRTWISTWNQYMDLSTGSQYMVSVPDSRTWTSVHGSRTWPQHGSKYMVSVHGSQYRLSVHGSPSGLVHGSPYHGSVHGSQYMDLSTWISVMTLQYMAPVQALSTWISVHGSQAWISVHGSQYMALRTWLSDMALVHGSPYMDFRPGLSVWNFSTWLVHDFSTWIPDMASNANTLLSLSTFVVLLNSLTITEPSTETIFKAKGDSVSLMCSYVVDPTETGSLDIEWFLMNPDSTALDKVLLTYMDNTIVSKGPPELMSRLKFSANDPSKGDASITISYLVPSDSGTYQCKVKKNPGVAFRKVSLTVQDEGTSPLSYKWEKFAGPPNPAIPPLNMWEAAVNGDLLIKNVSEVYNGQYRCTVVNNVGSGQCTVELTASAASNRAGVIAGAVIGAILLLLLLLLLIWLLICCCNKRRYEKEIENDIREDVAAPPSTNNSRASSVRTALGYRPHNISYSLRKAYNAAPRVEIKTPSETSSDPVKLRVASTSPSPDPVIFIPGNSVPPPYSLQRVGVPVMVPAQSREGFIV